MYFLRKTHSSLFVLRDNRQHFSITQWAGHTGRGILSSKITNKKHANAKHTTLN